MYSYFPPCSLSANWGFSGKNHKLLATVNATRFSFRHSQPASRPTFTDMVVLLQRPDFQLLWWSEEDKVSYSEKARTLGGPVEDGEEMYMELQKTYFELAAD